MDEQLETPDALEDKVPKVTSSDAADAGDEGESSGEEDVPDWTRFASAAAVSASKKQIIPQRGDKEFEPSRGGETQLQSFALTRARNAMFDALRVDRGSTSKTITHGVWRPRDARVEVLHAKGQAFNTMGHFWTANTAGANIAKKLVLLPEEALYLIERGSMFCWKEMPGIGDSETAKVDGDGGEDGDRPKGAPMSVQQAFAEMVGREEVTMEKYQVFAYLRRLGYTVTRSQSPASSPLYPSTRRPSPSLMARLWAYTQRWMDGWQRRLRSWSINWWRPLSTGWCSTITYRSIFSSIRFIPSNSTSRRTPALSKLQAAPSSPQASLSSPYQIFFHVWKPNTPWKKTSVPPPDFEVIIVNASTTPLPTLAELSTIFAQLPIQPPPLPRKRLPPVSAPRISTPSAVSASLSTASPSILTRMKILLGLLPSLRSQKPPRTNPFMALKAGRKSVVIAAVDGGSVSFVRFGEGTFEDWPMVV